MPGDKNFTEISIRTNLKKQYKSRVKAFKVVTGNEGKFSKQLEFDLELIGAIKKDPPTPPEKFIPLLQARIAELEKLVAS